MMDLDFDKLFTHKIILESSEPGLVIEVCIFLTIYENYICSITAKLGRNICRNPQEGCKYRLQLKKIT